MTKRARRRAKALTRPTSLPIADAIALMVEAGWEHRQQGTSHHKFTKPGMRTLMVVESHGRVGEAAVEDIADAIEAAEE